MSVQDVAANLEQQLADLLNELSSTQEELLALLAEKRELMAANQFAALAALQAREQQLCDRLEQCQQRRAALLQDASDQGVAAGNLQQLARMLEAGGGADLHKLAKQSVARMRLLQHQSLTNWVLAQRALLHVSQLIEIIATGGRLQPTYGNELSSHARGALMDQEI